MSRTMKTFLVALTLSTSFFLMAGDASAQFVRSGSTSVAHVGGVAGGRAVGPWRAGGVAAAGSATSLNHEVTRSTPLGSVSRGTEIDTARGGVAAGGVGGLWGGARGGFRAGSISHSRTAVR